MFQCPYIRQINGTLDSGTSFNFHFFHLWPSSHSDSPQYDKIPLYRIARDFFYFVNQGFFISGFRDIMGVEKSYRLINSFVLPRFCHEFVISEFVIWVQTVVGSIVWAFRRLKKPRRRWAPAPTRFIACAHNFPTFLVKCHVSNVMRVTPIY